MGWVVGLPMLEPFTQVLNGAVYMFLIYSNCKTSETSSSQPCCCVVQSRGSYQESETPAKPQQKARLGNILYYSSCCQATRFDFQPAAPQASPERDRATQLTCAELVRKPRNCPTSASSPLCLLPPRAPPRPQRPA